MVELLEEVKELARKELDRANDMHPLFGTDHEGVCVIEEEMWEAQNEFNANLVPAFEQLKYGCVFTDNASDRVEYAQALERSALYVAAEATQVAAMARKFIDSLEHREAEEGTSCEAEMPDYLKKFDKGFLDALKMYMEEKE